MKKVLFTNEQELTELVELNFGVQADNNVAEVEVDEIVTDIDVIELYPTEDNLSIIVNKLKEKLNITASEIYEKKSKDGNKILMVDFINLRTLLEEKHNIKLSGTYESCCCDFFEKPMLAFEIE